MFKLHLKKTEEPEIKLPVFIGDHRKGKRIPEKKSTSLSTLKPLTLWIITKGWEILKEMGIPDHLICLLRSLYAGQKSTVRTVHGGTDWFQNRKGVR